MKQRFTRHTEEEADLESEAVHRQRDETGLAFDSPESMIRYDTRHTPLPEQIRDRVWRSIEAEPAPTPWWKRWLRR